MRIDKINYYLDIAQTVAERATCMRRRFGSVIVKNDAIISTGYNGAPRGRANCTDLGYCLREKFSIPTGTWSSTRVFRKSMSETPQRSSAA